MSVVADASAVVGVLLDGIAFDGDLHAPDVVDVEVLSTLRRLALAGSLTSSHARESLDGFLGLDIRRHDGRRLLPRMWDLRHDISAYDAAYVVLAEALGVPLVTLDRRLAATARRYCDVIED